VDARVRGDSWDHRVEGPRKPFEHGRHSRECRRNEASAGRSLVPFVGRGGLGRPAAGPPAGRPPPHSRGRGKRRSWPVNSARACAPTAGRSPSRSAGPSPTGVLGAAVPGFGDPAARLLVVGLAPAAHGGNRAGRVFTGDSSGDWLYEALWRHGFASQPHSVSRDDGMRLDGCWITAAGRCAPPDKQALPVELDRCRPWLVAEIALLKEVRVVTVLGHIAPRLVAAGRGWWTKLARGSARSSRTARSTACPTARGCSARTTRAGRTRRPAG